MATFLDLLERAYASTGMQGRVYSVDDPGLPGVLARNLSQAWASIQDDESKDFSFMDDIINFDLQVSRTEYTPDEIFGTDVVKFGSFKDVYYQKKPLIRKDISGFRFAISDWTPGPPSFCSVDLMTDNLLISEVDKVYRVGIQYERATQILEKDDDVLWVNKKNQDAIMWLGLLNFANDIGNKNLQMKADKMYTNSYCSFCQRYNKPKKMKSRYYVGF